MAENHVLPIETIVADAFALMRQRLKAQGIEVTHVIVAIAPDGTSIIRSNVVPGALAELADLANMLKAIGDLREEPSPDDGTRH